ncbi:MAG: MarR family winged helix-turn-helix transcriptional regulator [Alphaproteobacteria bacterium]
MNTGSEFGFALGEIARRWGRGLDDRLKSEGLSLATWKTLVYLARHGDGLSQKALAELLRIEGPSLVRLLDSLQQGGLIERQTSERDRRSKIVHLTSQGQDRLTETQGVVSDVRSMLLQGISDEELRVCLAIFDRINRNARTQRS